MTDHRHPWSSRARAALRAARRWGVSQRRRFDNDFRPLFICGVAGSGTTLMSSLLDQRYDNAAVFHESALRFSAPALLRMQSVGDYIRLSRYAEAMWLSTRSDPRRLRAEMLKLYRARCADPKTASAIIDKAPNVHLVRAAHLQAAFPDARFVLIFRDPVANLEGLRRKWTVFRDAELEELCTFWETLHRTFMAQTKRFEGQVRGLSFERLVHDADREVERLSRWCTLSERTAPRSYGDRPNDPGKGLRGVVGGQIRVDASAARARGTGLTDAERAVVQRRLSALYRELVERYDGPQQTTSVTP